ncbi:50S ribosomal protein L18 [Candidatus Saccharibacteria bacterium]|nr:50S ribosomal protein L18 [Candidatus Saccharibacteria bacterium]
MNRLIKKVDSKQRRKTRIRNVVKGTSERPRMTVTISNRNVSAQIINDETHATIISASSQKLSSKDKNMTEIAALVGKDIAEKAKKAKVKQVVLDRNGKLYHGRIKAFADEARKAGLEF